ncbi:MAG: hypothetical protein ACUVS7_01655 [Bryobacteraceae bacterium]
MSLRLFGVLFFPAVLAAGQPCRLPPLGGSRAFPGAEAVRSCAPQRLGIREPSYQLLVDDSGSMRGLSRQLPSVAAWIEQALSHMRRFEMSWSRLRACGFSSTKPLERCSAAQLTPASFTGSGDTTLDTAIESARDFDLTLIVTDGAGASGTPTRACASGVDAACVGRALAQSLQPGAGEPAGLRGGLWVIPLMAPHSGPLYTEQRAKLSEIDLSRIRTAVAEETGATTVVGDLRLDTHGRLYYRYSGPRVFFLFVIARRTDLGRAFLAALQARMEYAQVSQIGRLTDYRGSLAALPAVEVFPGVMQGLRWTRLQVLQPACITFEARLRPDGKVAIGCSNRTDEAVVALTAFSPPESLDCARLLNLPLFQVELRPDARLGSVREASWRGSALAPADPLQLRLRLMCSREWQSQLSRGYVTAAKIISRRNIAATVEALIATRPGNPAVQLLRSLSSSSVIYAPHRALQLTETLERFYRSLEPSAAAPTEVVLGQVDLCWIQ